MTLASGSRLGCCEAIAPVDVGTLFANPAGVSGMSPRDGERFFVARRIETASGPALLRVPGWTGLLPR